MKFTLVSLFFLSTAVMADAGFTMKFDKDAVESGLGETQSVVLTLTANEGFTGAIRLSVTNLPDAAVTPKGTFAVKFDPEGVDFSKIQSTKVVVTIAARTDAADFKTKLGFLADGGSDVEPVKTELMYDLKPIYNVYLKGPSGKEEEWSMKDNSTVGFIPHKDGVTVRFINMDAKSGHRIHSGGGPIPHQGNGLAPYPGNNNSHIYEFKVTSTAKASSTVYCHDHENVAGRTLTFNTAPATE